jgi:uncharacterized oligopeptide transporter (OPT) family protein
MHLNKHSKVAFITSGVLLVVFPLAVILHNFISALINAEEPVFFIIAIACILILPFAVLYALIALLIASMKSPAGPKAGPTAKSSAVKK